MEIILSFVFRDQIYNNRMMAAVMKEREFLYQITFGFMPRIFRHDDTDDRIICDQDDEISELYYMKDCNCGIAINT